MLSISDFRFHERHTKTEKLLLESEQMHIDHNQVGKHMHYRQDGSIYQDSTFDDEGYQIDTHWTFWDDGLVAQDCPYVKGERQGEGFHYHPDTGEREVSIHRFYRNDRIQGKEKFYDIQQINWLVDILQDSRILRRIKYYDIEEDTNMVDLNKVNKT